MTKCKCSECGREIHSNRRTCGDACRVARHRRKKREASDAELTAAERAHRRQQDARYADREIRALERKIATTERKRGVCPYCGTAMQPTEQVTLSLYTREPDAHVACFLRDGHDRRRRSERLAE